MLKRNWALIALVYLALAELLSWSPVPDLALCLIQPEYSEQAADNNEPKYCPALHTGIIAAIDASDGFLERHDKSVIGAFTIVLAISTIGLWLATHKLWTAGESQKRLAEETAERQLRAYVNVEIGQILNFGTGTCRIRIVFKNTGQTPAYKFSYWANAGGDTLPHQTGFSPTPNDPRVIQSVLAAGAQATAFCEYGPLKASHTAGVLNGTHAIWSWGEVTYLDIFKKRRTTKFRMVFKGIKTTPAGGMSVDEEGNEAD